MYVPVGVAVVVPATVNVPVGVAVIVPETTCVPEGIFLTITAVSVPEGATVKCCAAAFETLTVYVPVGVAPAAI